MVTMTSKETLRKVNQTARHLQVHLHMCNLSMYTDKQADKTPPRQFFVRVTLHPRSGLPSCDSDLETARTFLVWLKNERLQPWLPFATENDFKFAEHITHMNMSTGDLDWFLEMAPSPMVRTSLSTQQKIYGVWWMTPHRFMKQNRLIWSISQTTASR